MRHIEIMDTTLRDGEQTSGVSFSASEKLTIAQLLLKEVMVDRLEIASARVSEGEFAAVISRTNSRKNQPNMIGAGIERIRHHTYYVSQRSAGRNIKLRCAERSVCEVLVNEGTCGSIQRAFIKYFVFSHIGILSKKWASTPLRYSPVILVNNINYL